MPVTLSVVSFGAEATEALQKAISAAQQSDRLSPVTVVAPSNYANLSLRRQLASGGPLVNVRFLVFSRLAELLGAPLLSRSLLPLTPWIRAEAVRNALNAYLRTYPESRFAGVSAHPATGENLEGTFRDLREASEETLEKLATSSERAREVVAIFRRYRRLVDGRYYDEADLTRAAVEAVGAGSPAVRDVGHMLLYLPADLSEAEAALVVALGETSGATAILGATGEQTADASLLPMQAKLSGSVPHQPVFIPVRAAPVTHIAIVPDAEEEVGIAIRTAMAMARRGVPLNRVAFLYPNPGVYGPLVHERLEAAGIPHNGPPVGTLAQSIAGRFLLGLLRLSGTGLRRDAVMDWLTSGPALNPETGGAPAANLWETISREAGMVAGAAQSADRLMRYRVRLEEELIDPTRPLTEGQVSFRKVKIAESHRLQRFLEVLAADLERAVDPTWKAQSDRARWLLDRYMGAPANFEGCPEKQRNEAERAAYEQVLQQIAYIEALDAVAVGGKGSSEVDAQSFLQTLERLLDAPAGRVGPFGYGIFCGPVSIATGMDFDAVFMLGMTEGQMPNVGGEDPLLPDHERAHADPLLPTRAGRRGEQRRAYLAALASAAAANAQRTLVAPVADLRGQKKQLPSRWLLEAAGTLAGKTGPLATREFGAISAQSWLTRVSSFQAALRDSPEPGLAQEYDLRLMLSGSVGQQLLSTLLPALKAGMDVTTARSGRTLSQFEGVIGARPQLRPGEAKPTSATALQAWAKCPFSYFLKHVLRVGEREEPEDILVLNAAERGTIIHETLAKFMTANAGWSSPWEQRHVDQIVAMGEERCEDAEKQGITGKPVLWGVERQRISRDLEGFLEADSERRTQLGYAFVKAEYAFGAAPKPSPPVIVRLEDGSNVAFGGSIDRVDRHPDGRLAIYDYKTGGTFAYKGMDRDPLKGGTLLQLPIYALAAQRDFGDSSTGVWASYWFVTRQGEYAHSGYEVTADRLAEFRRALHLISKGMRGGNFPANPGKTDTRTNGSTNCTYCPYDRICPRDRQRAWERKKDAGAIVEYLALTAGATADDPD